MIESILSNVQVELPRLHIASIDQLITHEHGDVQRTAPLAMQIATEGRLKNPLIVTAIEGDNSARLVVLDGVNRLAALSGMGCPHIVVQTVPYESPHARLETWNHIITDVRWEDFESDFQNVDGIEYHEVDLIGARAGLAQREFLACVYRSDGRMLAVLPCKACQSVHDRTRLLRDFVNSYQFKIRLHRTTIDDWNNMWKMYPAMVALVVFPKFQPPEIIMLAREREKLPSGLTRHLIQGRALNLNYPLSELKSYDSLTEKNKRFDAWIKQKLRGRSIRYYEETTFLFDE